VGGIALIAVGILAARLRFVSLVAAGIGAVCGLALCGAVSISRVFDVALSLVSTSWVVAGCAAVGLAVAALRHARPWRKGLAIVAMPVVLLTAALGINTSIGQYTTVGSFFGVSTIPPLDASVLAAQRSASGDMTAPRWDTWVAPAALAQHGVTGSVVIPAVASGFAAREAVVYLPPAALLPNPPALPVLIMLSGQPGSPENVILAGQLNTIFDSFAAAHGGLAPIVVVPDQLGSPFANPMCVDSALGESETYLTVDVPAWIRANLHVQTAASAWGIGGWSQGGTCAIQLAAGHPTLFGSLLDVSGELEPRSGSVQQTIDRGFAGSSAAYEAAKPLNVLARNAPYAHTVGVFVAGQLDATYSRDVERVALGAREAGIETTLATSPGTGHDWYTVRFALEHEIAPILRQFGLEGPTS
jgi:S-formylglutathione hydrolase FrmB